MISKLTCVSFEIITFELGIKWAQRIYVIMKKTSKMWHAMCIGGEKNAHLFELIWGCHSENGTKWITRILKSY